MVARFSALAQPVRLAIYLAIAEHTEGVTSSRIAELTGAMPTNTSVHLSVLRNAGLVTSCKQGRRVIYRTKPDAIEGLIDFLDSIRSKG